MLHIFTNWADFILRYTNIKRTQSAYESAYNLPLKLLIGPIIKIGPCELALHIYTNDVVFANLYIEKPSPEGLYSFLSMCHIPHGQVKSVRRQKQLMCCVINALSSQIPSAEC